MSSIIEIDEVTKIFRVARGKDIAAVDRVSFSVDAGEVFGLLGPNGAGKTTLLRMLATIVTPTSGTVSIRGTDTNSPEDARRSIGFLSGNTRLYGRLTARETLRYFGRLYDLDEHALTARIEEMAQVLDMGAFMDQRVESLSTGQTQKVSIARVMLHDPPVLILDEPTLGLDIMTSRSILEFIGDARGRGRCIIFSTHYMTEAEMLCDRVGLIHAGQILAMGTPDELYANTGTTNLQEAFLQLVDGVPTS